MEGIGDHLETDISKEALTEAMDMAITGEPREDIVNHTSSIETLLGGDGRRHEPHRLYD